MHVRYSVIELKRPAQYSQLLRRVKLDFGRELSMECAINDEVSTVELSRVTFLCASCARPDCLMMIKL